jgi:peptidoglycan hydrolase-like protein with peptidoglycan-binding domain
MAVPKLGPGSTGDMVSALQCALVANGFSVGPAGPDGKFGNLTTAALGAFQDNKSLPVRPDCDQATWAALYMY